MSKRDYMMTAGSLVVVATAALTTPDVWKNLPESVALPLRAAREEYKDTGAVKETRGFYEDLMTARNFPLFLHSGYERAPFDYWPQPYVKFERSLPYRTQKPGTYTSKAATVEINNEGFCDREYARERPPDTYRILMMGDSWLMGHAVEPSQRFESLLEDKLNALPPDGGPARAYEILNFGRTSFTVVGAPELFEKQASKFEADAVIYVVLNQEENRMRRFQLGPLIARGGATLPPRLAEIVSGAGVEVLETKQDGSEVAARLSPVTDELVEYGYGSLAEAARGRGLDLFVVAIPRIHYWSSYQDVWDVDLEPTVQIAKRHGFEAIRIEGLWDDHDARKLWVHPWDTHPSPRAHVMIADALYEQLSARLGSADDVE